MEETVVEIVEQTVSNTETLQYLETITQRLETNEVYMTYILGLLIVFFLYGCFKFFSKFLGMFFQ